MNDLAQIIGLSPDGDWEDEMELAERCHSDSCPHQMGEGCHHKPDCTHYCEDGHFSGDDMVMAEIGTGWPARWETTIEAITPLLEWAERVAHNYRVMRQEPPFWSTLGLWNATKAVRKAIGQDRPDLP